MLGLDCLLFLAHSFGVCWAFSGRGAGGRVGALWSGMRVVPVAFVCVWGGGVWVGRVVFAGCEVSGSAGGCPGRSSVVVRGFWCRFFRGATFSWSKSHLFNTTHFAMSWC